MSTQIKAIIPPFIMLVFGIILLFIIPEHISRGGSTSNVNPRFIPYLLSGAIIGLSIISIITELVKRRGISKDKDTNDFQNKKEVIKSKKGYAKVIIALAAMVLWVVLIPHLGFIIVTYLLTIGMMFLMGNRKKTQLIIVPVVFTAVVYYGIKVFMNVPLPSGIFL